MNQPKIISKNTRGGVRNYLVFNEAAIRITIQKGPWISQVDPNVIKLRPRVGYRFPEEIGETLNAENKS